MDLIINDIKDEAPSDSSSLHGLKDYYQNILLCLGYEEQHLPLADLLKYYHHLSGQWFVATPVHWEATHNDAVLVAGAKELALSEEESRLWFKEVADFLKDDGFNPVYHDAQTWLFKAEGKPPFKSKSLSSILHQSLMPLLTNLDNSLYWQRLFTELQMYLSAHPLNLRRESELPVNGLWFWGEGCMQKYGKKVITTDDKILQAWADETGQKMSVLSANSNIQPEQLIVIYDAKQIKLCNLEDKIKKNQVNWYWNNCSYSKKAAAWWSRLWS